MKIRSLLAALLIGALLPLSVFAQLSPQYKRKSVDKRGIPEYVELEAKQRQPVPMSQAPELLKSLWPDKNPPTMHRTSQQTDKLGMVHEVYQQTYQGLTIEGATYRAHSNRNRELQLLTGHFYPTKGLTTKAQLTREEALQKALDAVGADQYKWQIAEEEAWLKKEQDNPQATYFPKGELLFYPLTTDSLYLAYKFDIYAQSPMSRDWLYVDARNGRILARIPILAHAEGIGDTRYSGQRKLFTYALNDTSYILRDTTRGKGIQTYNLRNSGTLTNGNLTGIAFSEAVDFRDRDNRWTAEEFNNASFNNAALDAHWGAVATYDYFLKNFGRNSYDGNGIKMNTYMHAGRNYFNAFWDGQRVTIGDGNSNPLSSLDIVAHEYGHALMTSTANLVYQNESGALNEGFSDIWAAAVEMEFAPEKDPWLIGEDIGNTIRSMRNPKQFNQPDTYRGQNWFTGTANNGGVHVNSGVLNYWFYLLTQGGNGTNDLGKSYQVSGIGIQKSTSIAYRTLTVYLTSTSQYADMAQLSLRATQDLYGEDSNELRQAYEAWKAVGLAGALFEANNTTYCQTGVIQFTDRSLNGVSWQWFFEGGQPATSSVKNPIVFYQTPGPHDARLIVTNSFGFSDTLTRTDYLRSSTVILNETPHVQNFEQSSVASLWGVLNGNNDRDNNNTAHTWNYINLAGANSRSGNGYYSFYGSSTQRANDWLFSNCFQFSDTVLYEVSFWYRQRDAGTTQDFNLLLLTRQDTNSVVRTLASYTTNNTTYRETKLYVKVPKGVYYLAWQMRSRGGQGNFYIDDLQIKPANDFDVRVAQISQPFGECQLTSATPFSFIVENIGNESLTNLPVKYVLKKGTEVVANGEVVIASLPFGERGTGQANLDLSTVGSTYTVEAEAILLNDSNLGDNKGTLTLTNAAINGEIAVSLNNGKLEAPVGFSSYQWILNGEEVSTFQGGGSQQFTPSQAGDYRVRVTNGKGCSAVSNTFTFAITSTEPALGEAAVLAYPNPTSGRLDIALDHPAKGTLAVSVYDLLGKNWGSYSFQKANDRADYSLDLSDLPNALYFVRIQVAGYQQVLKVVKE